MRDVRRSGRSFRERGCILEYQIFRFAEMILRDRCSTSYDLASIFRGRQVEWKNRKTHWYAAVRAALNFPFLKEVSQNCFDFDVVKCKNGGSLAELLRFLCCQLCKMKRSRRIASFLKLLSSNIGEVSQNCFVFDSVNFENEDISQNSLVFKLADRQVDR